MSDARTRDRGRGTFAHDIDRRCTCGHTLGTHTADACDGARPCLAGELGEGECSCSTFTPERSSARG